MWSCGDYSNNTTGFTISNSTAVVTGEKSVNGLKSIKINKDPTTTLYVQVFHSYSVSSNIEGKTAKLSGNVQNNTDGNVTLQLQCMPNGSLKSVSISPNQEFTLAEITDTNIASDTTSISCKIAYPSSINTADVFIDNLKLTIE